MFIGYLYMYILYYSKADSVCYFIYNILNIGTFFDTSVFLQIIFLRVNSLNKKKK